jgi:hypothetical protein
MPTQARSLIAVTAGASVIDKTSSQYVAQKRSSSTNTGVWIGKSHCTTREELLNVCSRLKLLSDANVEAVLTGAA